MTVQELKTRFDKLEGFYEGLKIRHQALEKEVTLLKDEAGLLAKASAVLKHLLDIMVKDEINRMAGLMTFGLKTVFDDQRLTFVPVMSKKGDRVHIELTTHNGDIVGSFGSFGGSVAVIESFLLRILCMLKMNLARFMILDETFAAVGAEYIPSTSRLINEIAKKLNMDILLVTHQPEFQAHANHVYKVKESSKGLLMEKIK
jgi:DNA repair ATPase RecN